MKNFRSLNSFIFTLLFFAGAASIRNSFAIQMGPVTAKLGSVLGAGHHPVAIFDLDETLVHSTQRKFRSYQLALEQNQVAFEQSWPVDTARALDVFHRYGSEIFSELPNEYDSHALFAQMDISNVDFIKAVDSKMIGIYLNQSELIQLDKPVQGAITFLQLIRANAGKVFFVSSRYQDTQGQPTLENLFTHHLFVSGVSNLVLRERGQTSLDFKTKAMDRIRQTLSPQDEVFLVAENEPENLNAMMAAYPGALPVFRDGAILNQAVALQTPERVLHFKNWVRE